MKLVFNKKKLFKKGECMKRVVAISIVFLGLLSANVELNKPLPSVTLSGDSGYYNGKEWSSNMLKGKTTMLMYVDPDEKYKGEEFKAYIEKMEKELDFNKFQILVVLNTGATWKPKFLIKKLMDNKLKKYPKRIYVFDNGSKLVKEWGLRDDEYNVVLIDKDLKPIYQHKGKWSKEDMENFYKLVKKQINK